MPKDRRGKHSTTQERTAVTPTSASSSTTPVRTMGSRDVGGTTKIADAVIARIAAPSARNVPGVHEMTATGFGGLRGRVVVEGERGGGG